MSPRAPPLRSALALLAVPLALLVAGCASFAPPEGPCGGVALQEVTIDVTVGRYHFTPGTDAPLEVPLCAMVVLRVTSEDVTHGLAVDGYRVSEEIPAGQTVEIRFLADKAGDFTIYCTVFCGAGHPQHKGTLHVG